MAEDYIGRSARTLQEAGRAYAVKDFPLTVRRAQEAVELSLKAALRSLAVEYPREQDLSEVLLRLGTSRDLPGWFQKKIPSMARVSRELARSRGPAFYGDERALKPPSALFDRSDARKSLMDATGIFRFCKRLILHTS